ncbi:electron transfer flavoprotein subunit alpha/FixB family protein [bacterium]|nr:electron transfer flavoprotein subunit alpha/FixB family protein [bacterium]
MSKILIIAEQRDNQLKKTTLSSISFAKKENLSFDILVLGSDVEGVAKELSEYGAERVLFSSSPLFQNFIAKTYAEAVYEVVTKNNYEYIVSTSTTTGKDFLPRVAAKLNAGMASDIIGTEKDGDSLLFKRPIWAGAAIALTEITTALKVVSVRVSAYSAAEKGDVSPIEGVTLSTISTPNVKFISLEENKSTRPELTEAMAIVSGGKGLKSKENFNSLLEPLADALSGAIGASRLAVDSGYAANDLQVGQTGKSVAPNLYIAVAISGAIQHLAGMKDSKVIVAINKDDEAPIFEVADYGLVEDAFSAVPKLTELINSGK